MNTKTLFFSGRNAKEILRDPVSLAFGVGLPVALLLIITALQKSISGMTNTAFAIENFAPGTAMFSLAFVTMFGGMLIAGDKESSFLTRLFASPLSALNFILGYTLPLIPIGLMQIAFCFLTAFFLGLPVTVNVLLSAVALLPAILLFTGFGLLLGVILTNKQMGPIASILVQIVAFGSGMWFDLSLVGGIFQTVCNAMPFYHALELAKMGLSGNFTGFLPHIFWVLGYTVLVFGFAIVLFRKKMKN